MNERGAVAAAPVRTTRPSNTARQIHWTEAPAGDSRLAMHEAKILFDLLQSPDKIDWNALRNYVYDHAPEDYEGSWHDLLVTIFNRAYDLARLQTCQFPTGFSVKSLRLAWVDMLIQAVGSAAESWDDPVVYDRLRDNIIAGIKQRVHAKRAS